MRTPSTGYGVHPVTGASTYVFWPFDFGSGALAYDVFRGRNLADPSALWSTGLIGRSVAFAGAQALQDGVTAAGADAATLQGAFTAEVWVRVLAAPTSGNRSTIFEYGDRTTGTAAGHSQLSIEVNSDLTFRWFWEGAADYSQNSTAKLRLGVWQHIAITKASDGAGTFTVTSYLNGVADNVQTTIQPPTSGTSAYWIFGHGKAGYLTGEICSCHIQNAAVDSTTLVKNWRRGVLWDDPTSATHGVAEIQVSVAPTWGGGTAYELTAFQRQGFDFVQRVSISDSVDQSAATATIGLKRSIFEVSLAPLMEDSPVNQNPQPSITHPGPASSTYAEFLGIGATVYIYARRKPMGVDDNLAAPGALIFTGKIDTVQWAGETIEVSARDLGAALLDDYIESERNYNTTGDASIENTIAAILTAESTGVSLYTPTSPGQNFGAFRQRREPVMTAVKTLADQIGWNLKYRFDPITQTERFTLYDPGRTTTRFDGIITVSDYDQINGISKDIIDVRNAVRVAYRDSTGEASGVDENDNPIFPPASITRTDTQSISDFGRRFMEISDTACPNIDTEAEAIAMADAILNDLSTPQVLMDLSLPYWEIEVGDRLKFEENTRMFDTPQTLAVLSIQLSFEGGRGRTSLQLKETPASHRQKWLVSEARNGRALPPLVSVEDSPTDFGFRGEYAPVVNGIAVANQLANMPSLAGVQNSAFLVHPAGVHGIPEAWDAGSLAWGPAASGGDVYFNGTSQTGDRSLELNTVGAAVTSWWMPVIGGRTYEARAVWQGNHATDQLQVEIVLYDGNRTATSSSTVINQAVAALNTFQTDLGIATTAAGDRWAKVIIQKKAGTRILVDRIHLDVITEAFEAAHSSPQSILSGSAVTVKWDAEVYDFGSAYDPAAGTFTAIEGGFHKFSAFVAMTISASSPLTGAQLDCKVGGVTRLSSYYTPSSGVSFAGLWLHTFPLRLDRGDVVSFDLTVPTPVTVTGNIQGGRFPMTER